MGSWICQRFSLKDNSGTGQKYRAPVVRSPVPLLSSPPYSYNLSVLNVKILHSFLCILPNSAVVFFYILTTIIKIVRIETSIIEVFLVQK